MVSLISRGLRDEIFATMSLDIDHTVSVIARLLTPSAFVERFCIALLVTTRVVRGVEKFVEVKVLQDFASFFLVLLRFFIFRLFLSSSSFLVWAYSSAHEFFLVACNVKLGIFKQLLQAVSSIPIF